jgi:hypothetical protein
MKLSADELSFLRCWMYDEVHYRDGPGRAKRLQVEHQVAPSDLGLLIAASMPEPAEQEAAAAEPPSQESPIWPWTEGTFQARLSQARAVLAKRTPQFSA